MNNTNSKGTWFIIVSLIIAMFLTLFPFPESWQNWRPSWVMLILTYWVIALPERIGLLWAFIFGIFMDVLLGTTLGVHSFALATTTFVIQILHKRIRLFPYWKQALSIAGVSILYVAIVYWLVRLTGKSESDIAWQSIMINALLWPWLYLILRNLTNYFKVK